MKDIFIIQFTPIEHYPPIKNLLRELDILDNEKKILVCSTTSTNNYASKFLWVFANLKKVSFGRSGPQLTSIMRNWYYFIFNTSCLIYLIWHRPRKVMYFESLSAFPIYLYKQWINSKAEILVHYHEYISPHQYQSGMSLQRFFHHLEKTVYHRFSWVSHTNQLRMDMFKQDIFPSTITNPQIIPNYPPVKWKTLPKPTNSPLRIVYVGSLSLTTMYVEAFANWVVGKQGEVVWDIYSYNYTAAAEKLIDALNCPWIRLCPAVEYDQLPEILRKYDVGVILYTGHIPNYVYNAPNKLFEYLACGLDVWFPKVMVGSLQYVRDKMLPKVLAFEFDNLANINLITAMDRQYVISNNTFFCEDVLLPLINKLTSHD